MVCFCLGFCVSLLLLFFTFSFQMESLKRANTTASQTEESCSSVFCSACKCDTDKNILGPLCGWNCSSKEIISSGKHNTESVNWERYCAEGGAVVKWICNQSASLSATSTTSPSNLGSNKETKHKIYKHYTVCDSHRFPYLCCALTYWQPSLSIYFHLFYRNMYTRTVRP